MFSFAARYRWTLCLAVQIGTQFLASEVQPQATKLWPHHPRTWQSPVWMISAN